MGESNQDKVKQDIVSYIMRNDAFNEVENGKFWRDLKEHLNLKQSFMSLKSMFFLTILKDIKSHHPIYTLNEDERSKFVALIKNIKKPSDETQIPDFLSTQESSCNQTLNSASQNVRNEKGSRNLPSFLKSQNIPNENSKNSNQETQSQNKNPANNLDEICSVGSSQESFMESFMSLSGSGHPDNIQNQRIFSSQDPNTSGSETEDISKTFRRIIETNYNKKLLIDYSNPNWLDLIYQDDHIYDFELPNYDIPSPKKNLPKNNTKTRKRSAEKITNLQSNKKSKFNEIPLRPATLLSSRKVKQDDNPTVNVRSQEKETVNNNKTKPADSTTRGTSVTAISAIPKVTLTDVMKEKSFNNDENKTATRSVNTFAVNELDDNEFGSPRSTQDLYLQAEMELNKETSSTINNHNNNNLSTKSANVTLRNVTKNLKATSRGSVANGQLKLNREAVRNDIHITNLLNTLIKYTSNAANKFGTPVTSSLVDQDEENLYLDITNLGDIDISSIPGSQELFDWIKNGGLEETNQNEFTTGTSQDISEFKLKYLLEKHQSKKNCRNIKKIALLEEVNKKNPDKSGASILSNSQELNLVNNEIANFLANRKKTVDNGPDTEAVLEKNLDAPMNVVKETANKDLFEPPKAPMGSSFDQECAIEDVTDPSVITRQSLRKRKETISPDAKQTVNAKIQKKSEKKPKVSKHTRKGLYVEGMEIDPIGKEFYKPGGREERLRELSSSQENPGQI